MAEIEKKGTEKAKVSLIIIAVLVVILAISSVLLYARIVTLENEIRYLKAPQLHLVGEYWTDNYPLSASIDLYGSVFNSGSQTAYNVTLTVRIYDTNDALLKTREIPLGNIVGKSFETVDIEVQYSGDADHVISTLEFD